VRQHTSCNEDLRALLQSEREQVASARGEMEDLKRQLATARASRKVAADAEAESSGGDSQGDAPPARPVAEPPPWSALDDELLARIERAKALTG
jgi:hypothetical protein